MPAKLITSIKSLLFDNFQKFLLIMFILLAFLISLDLFFQSSTPTTQGELTFDFLAEKVTVHRDKWGIPHIFAQNNLDAYRALGFVAASDRLFQMDLLRRAAAGTLSEIFGEKTIEQDKLARVFRIRRSAEELVLRTRDKMPTDMLQAVHAYLQGLNHFIDSENLPIEFKILQFKPKHFNFVDILALNGQMALGFANGYKGDILFSKLREKLSEDKIGEMRVGAEQSVPPKTTLSPPPPLLNLQENLYRTSMDALNDYIHKYSGFHGSNSFVLAPSRTQSGYAMLANDPHLKFNQPGMWYEAHIKTPNHEIYGHYIAYSPFAILGHNAHIAWGLTVSLIDDIDIYQEKIDPTRPGYVLYQNEWTNMNEYDEIIAVRDGIDQVVKIELSPHGPLLTPIIRSESPDQALSLKWAYHHPQNFTLQAFYQMNQALNLLDFQEALKLGASPGLNVTYADSAGNIAWWVMGKIPIRPEHVRSDVILNGASGADEYEGYLPFAKNPHLINPENGVIISANFQPGPHHDIDGYYEPSERYQTLNATLASIDKWSVDAIKKVQTQDYIISYKEILPTLLISLDKDIYFRSELYKEAFSYLNRWDGHSATSSIAQTIYATWNREILNQVIRDELSVTERKIFCQLADHWHFYKYLLKNDDSRWWDDVTTQGIVETRSQIISNSFIAAISKLKEELGSDITRWRWGRIHTIYIKHPLGQFWPLTTLFNIGPYASAGGYNQVNNMKSRHCTDSFQISAGPSTRRIIDFQNPLISFGALPTGNSGNPLNRNYRDQSELFFQGNYRQQMIDQEKIEAEAVKKLTLLPSQKH